MIKMLDTNICIYIIKNCPALVRQRFEEHGREEMRISVITIAELEFGVWKSAWPEKNKRALAQFLSPLNFVDFDEISARVYGKIRADLQKKGKLIGTMDMLIASQCLAHGLTLVSNNLREFARIPGLSCENWLE